MENKTEGIVELARSLYLDVATKYTGYALFERSIVHPIGHNLIGYGLIKGGNYEWQSRAINMEMGVLGLVKDTKPGVMLQEFPTFQAGTRGLNASQSGDTIKMAYVCGKISSVWESHQSYVLQRSGVKLPMVRLTPFTEWNGQLPKEITCSRMEEHFRLKAKSDSIENNWADAVMMGKWYLTKILKEKVFEGCSLAKQQDY